ncbi:hypothetical protein B296_00017215 [Ensete ventricosum]|uniref:Uncharacterized protein n=1 Tax=Ensete ventricosum TaxID=4639 RepID=A0A426ZPG6_ENSVE|nr:hypothetical protein B296_00017215 [Ensete ventricosum]
MRDALDPLRCRHTQFCHVVDITMFATLKRHVSWSHVSGEILVLTLGYLRDTVMDGASSTTVEVGLRPEVVSLVGSPEAAAISSSLGVMSPVGTKASVGPNVVVVMEKRATDLEIEVDQSKGALRDVEQAASQVHQEVEDLKAARHNQDDKMLKMAQDVEAL